MKDRGRYRNAAGVPLPSVTTVLGVLDKPALLGWAAQMEREHAIRCLSNLAGSDSPPTTPGDWLERLSVLMGPEWAWKMRRDYAADVGATTHARIEAFLKGERFREDGIPPDALDQSVHGFVAFHDWWGESGLKVRATELALVSETHQVGGRLDVLAEDDGGLTLVDIKTSKRSDWWPYDEMIGQVAAYRAIYHEGEGDPIQRVMLWRVGKEANDVGERYEVSAQEIEAGWQLFLAALGAYRAKAALRKGR